jgi:hypothetical protein
VFTNGVTPYGNSSLYTNRVLKVGLLTNGVEQISYLNGQSSWWQRFGAQNSLSSEQTWSQESYHPTPVLALPIQDDRHAVYQRMICNWRSCIKLLIENDLSV